MKSGIFISAFLAINIFLSVGCSKKDMNAGDRAEESIGQDTAAQVKYFTLEEIEAHSSEGDCWLVIDGKVYDVSEFVSSHPGGRAILEGCGKDATELFRTRPMGSGTPHSDRAWELLKRYYIGELKE